MRMTRTATRPGSLEISDAFFVLRSCVQFNAEKAKSIADPLADERRVFADAPCEDERVQSTERRGEGADPFFGLIAEKRHGFRRTKIIGFPCEQIAHIGTDLGNSKQPGRVVHHFLKLRRAHLLGAREVGDQSRIKVARAAAHHQSGRRRETHAGVDALAVAHGGEARAVAEMRKDHATLRCRRVADACKFPHEEFIRQTVEAITANACRLVASRNRQETGDARHGAVKRGVIARDLRQRRMALAECLYQFDLKRQMVWIVRRDSVQFIEQLWRDPLRFAMRHSMDHAMSHGFDRSKYLLRFEPIQ